MSAEITTKIRSGAVEDKLTAYHIWVLVVAVLGFAAVAADSALLPTALPLLAEDLNLDLSKLGYIYAAGFLVCGVVSISVGGRAIDKWGRKPVLVATLSVTAIFTMLSALSWDTGSFTVARTIATIGYMTWGTAAVLIAESVPAKHRAWMASCVPAGWGIGFGVSAMFSGQIATSIGWRPTFLMVGALPLILALLVAFTIKETPRFLAIKGMSSSERAALDEAKPSIRALFSPELRRRTFGVSLFFFSAVWINAFTSYYAMPYLTAQGIDFVAANQAITVGSWLGVLAAIAAGVFSVLRGTHGALIVLAVLSALSALALVLVGSSMIVPAFIVCLVWALALWGAAPNFSQESFPTWIRGTGGAFASGLAWSGYGVFALVADPLVNALSWDGFILLIAGPFMILCVVGILMTPRPARRNAVLTDF